MQTLLLALAALPQAGDVVPDLAASDSWTRFRGGAGTSVLAERSYPAEWGPETNVAWSIDLPGAGWSSPIVVRDRVFVSAAVPSAGADADSAGGPKDFADGVADMGTWGGSPKPTEELTFRLSCFALADGAPLWSRDVGTRVPAYGVHASNTYATESPASDGERVFVTFGALGELACFDLDGGELWRVETGVYRTGNDFGWGISLLTANGLVFLQNDNEEASFLAAFDAASGEERWRVDRGPGTSWGTPILWRTEGRTGLVACGRDAVVAYDPATGAEQWRVTGFGGSFSSSPTCDTDHVYFGNSGPMSRGPMLAVPDDLEGTLDLTKSADGLAWRADRAGPGFASPVVADGLLYVIGSSTILACFDTATGEQLWRERLPNAAQVVASPWVAGSELHVLDEEGTTFVIAVGPEFEVLRTNRMPGLYWGTPSVAGDALLLRDAERLHCIRE